MSNVTPKRLAYLNQALDILHRMLFLTACFGKEDSHVVAGLQFNLCLYPASTLRIHNVAVWLLFGQVPFLRDNYVATTYFR